MTFNCEILLNCSYKHKKFVKKITYITLFVFAMLSLIGVYAKLTYTPIENPTNDQDLIVEGIWFPLSIMLNIGISAFVFIILSSLLILKNLFKKR